MAPDDYRHKLAAILHADVAGYSRLMGDDEAETVRALTTYREFISSLVRQYRGVILDMEGDSVLAEYQSVSEAVRCAMEIQHGIQGKNAALPGNRKMTFRVGIHVGEGGMS